MSSVAFSAVLSAFTDLRPCWPSRVPQEVSWFRTLGNDELWGWHSFCSRRNMAHPPLLFQSCVCRVLTVLLLGAVPGMPLASSESQDGSWHLWGRGGVLGWSHSFRGIYSQVYPARLKLRTARPAAGGDKVRKGMGPSSQLFSLFP